jgi:hypothetical protein
VPTDRQTTTSLGVRVAPDQSSTRSALPPGPQPHAVADGWRAGASTAARLPVSTSTSEQLRWSFPTHRRTLRALPPPASKLAPVILSVFVYYRVPTCSAVLAVPVAIVSPRQVCPTQTSRPNPPKRLVRRSVCKIRPLPRHTQNSSVASKIQTQCKQISSTHKLPTSSTAKKFISPL